MTSSPETGNLQYQGLIVRRHLETGLICLNDLWKAQSSLDSKKPLNWILLETTQELLKRLTEKTGTSSIISGTTQGTLLTKEVIAEIPEILETIREGEVVLTYSSVELAVFYAWFLSPECYGWALTALVEGTQEGANFIEQIEEARLDRERTFARRALIEAGWAVPTVSPVKLPHKALAHTDSTMSGGGHIDSPL